VPPAGNDSVPPQTSRLSAAGNLSVLIVEDNRLTELNVDALCRLVPRRADSPHCADSVGCRSSTPAATRSRRSSRSAAAGPDSQRSRSSTSIARWSGVRPPDAASARFGRCVRGAQPGSQPADSNTGQLVRHGAKSRDSAAEDTIRGQRIIIIIIIIAMTMFMMLSS